MLYDLADRLATRQQRFAVVIPPDAPPRRAIELSGVEPAAWLHADRAVRARRARRLARAARNAAAPPRSTGSPCETSTARPSSSSGASAARSAASSGERTVDGAQPRRGARPLARRVIAEQPVAGDQRARQPRGIPSTRPCPRSGSGARRWAAPRCACAARAVALGHLGAAAAVEAHRREHDDRPPWRSTSASSGAQRPRAGRRARARPAPVGDAADVRGQSPGCRARRPAPTRVAGGPAVQARGELLHGREPTVSASCRARARRSSTRRARVDEREPRHGLARAPWSGTRTRCRPRAAPTAQRW